MCGLDGCVVADCLCYLSKCGVEVIQYRIITLTLSL